ncbi:MAG: 4-hydroxybutyrate CoA-transferase [Clostridiales bacterium]|nr:4-hydroxybutyrate CoA-transferase [Clostridiales bacterium]
MDWKEYYSSRLTTAEEAVKLIKSNDKVVLAHDVGEPPVLVDAMVANHAAYKNVEISHMFTLGKGEYCKPEYKENFHPNLWFLSGQTRKCVEEGYGDFTPLFFHEVPGLMRDGTIQVDVAMIMVTPPDKHGYVSTGVSGDYTVQAVKSAKTVIAQINKNVPFTFGDAVFHISEIDAFVEADTPLPELPEAKIGPAEEAIGKYCAELVNDGDTLQLGIGAIPDAVCHQLVNKKHLGIHSEMLGDGQVVLYEAGAIDNSQKGIDVGKFVFNFVMGSKKTYDFLDKNTACLLKAVDYVNHPMIIAKNPNMVSINGGIGVDFYGQVAADTIGYRQFSAVGGQVDFIRGAAMGKNGRAIIAMPSVAKKKDGSMVSKITPLLSEGQVVTTSRHDTDYVVTEYGIAKLKGKTVKDRARALINIAHPDFRDGLKDEFEKMFKVKF